MKKLIFTLCIGALFSISSNLVIAQENEVNRKVNEFHLKLKTKNKARTQALTHNGRVMHIYNETKDCTEGQIGNVIAGESVRKVFNYTVVDDPLISGVNNPIEIGNVDVEGKATDVVNIVDIEGDIMSIFQPISIGNVSLEEEGGTIENMVTINGSIHAQ